MAHGTFIIADISGHSRYLDSAGLVHASNVTAMLLNAIIEAAEEPWIVAKLEGDAVFFISPGREPPAQVLNRVHRQFREFLARVLAIGQDTDCGCGACAGSNRLTLKFIIHSGDYESRRIGDAEEAIGPAIVAAHRLLKTGLRLPEYVILTEQYLAADDPPALVVSRGSSETEMGTVSYVAVGLSDVRRAFERETQGGLSALEVLGRADVRVQCPSARVWEALLDPSRIRLWSGVEEVIYFPARAGNFGTVYVWRPAAGGAFANVVLSLDAERKQVTLCRSEVLETGRLYLTYKVYEGADGQAGVECAILGKKPPPRAAVKITRKVEAELSGLKRYCESPPA